MQHDKFQDEVSPEARNSLLDLCRAITSSENDLPASKEEKWDIFSTVAARLRVAHEKGIDLNHKSATFFWSLCARTLRDLGRMDEAVDILEESHSAMRHAIGESTTRRDRTLMLSSLKKLNQLHIDAGQIERACHSQREIVAIRRSLYDESPENFQSLFADDLQRYGDFLRGAGRLELALSAWNEYLEIQRRHQVAADLATSLRVYAGSVLEIGKHQEAYDAAREAVQIQRRLSFDSTTSELDLGDALRAFAKFLVKANRLDEACDSWNEALALYRLLASAASSPTPGAFRVSEFTNYLREYGDLLHATKRYEEACSVDGELVAHFRRLHQERPSLYSNNLAWALSLHGESLENTGKIEEACKALEESVALYRELFINDRPMFAPVLVPVLSEYAYVLYSLHSPNIISSATRKEPTTSLALSIAHEAIRMAHWVEWSEDAGNERLISALYRLARCLAERREWPLAQEAANEVRRLLPHSPDEAKTANLLREVRELESRCSEAIHSR